MRNIFLEKHTQNVVKELIPKKSKIGHISESTVSSFLQFVFTVCKVEDYRNILKLSCRPLKTFLKKQKRSLELVSLPQFPHDF